MATRRKNTVPRKAPPARRSGELLFEIGVEELPYQFIRPALVTLGEAAERSFKEQRLAHGRVRTMGTPRRLVLIVDEVAARQEPSVSEVMGPSKTVAYDGSGQPTKAAIGFAASHGIAVADLVVRQIPKGEYVFAVKRDPGRPTDAVLGGMLQSLIAGLSFPKAMKWNATGIRFGRPIRWLVALFAGRVIGLQYAGVTAGNRTYGHRALSSTTSSKNRGLQIKDFTSYMKVLENNGVLPDQEARRGLIVEGLTELAKSARGVLHRDEELLEQAVYTAEWPVPILGSFKPTYLSVPKEVLMTAMKEHQGYFSLVQKDGTLLPKFVCVTNMKVRNMDLIRAGNERVLAARLADAKFFFDNDRTTRLADRVDTLKGVVFHEKLGNLHLKTQRMMDLTVKLAELMGRSADAPTWRRAAELSKADLLTGLVGEFPTLQGIMGGEYAKHDGESEEVSRAVREHYLPKAMEGEIPETIAGRILSLADRLDTVVGFFHVGIVPSGSEDPLGLRRNALGIVRLIIEGRLTLDLSAALAGAKSLVEAQGFTASGAAKPLDFILDRLRYFGRTVHHLREDVMDAVLKPLGAAGAAALDLNDLLARMISLQDMTARQEFDPLIVGYKRAHRLVEKEKWSQDRIDPALFQHPSETELHKAMVEAAATMPGAIASGDYGRAMNTLVDMKPAIDGFFAAVMVNTDEAQVRANRLSLLYAVDRLFLHLGDFSHITVQGA
jgi:glycyl-tRNA synthetase beta chain